jgi:hypothetical protein
MQEPLPACSTAYGKQLAASNWQHATGSKQLEASSLQQAARSMQYLLPKLKINCPLSTPRFRLIVGYSGMVLTNNKQYKTSNKQHTRHGNIQSKFSKQPFHNKP